MPHFKAFGMMNFQYELRFCRKIHNKGTMSQWQIQVTIFLSGTDVTTKSSPFCILSNFFFAPSREIYHILLLLATTKIWVMKIE